MTGRGSDGSAAVAGKQHLRDQLSRQTEARKLIHRRPVQRKATDYDRKAGRRLDRAR